VHPHILTNKYSVFFLFLWYWGLNSGPIPWATLPAFFCAGLFWDRVLWTICLGWLWTAVLLISASWVAKDYRRAISGQQYSIFYWWNFVGGAATWNKRDAWWPLSFVHSQNLLNHSISNLYSFINPCLQVPRGVFKNFCTLFQVFSLCLFPVLTLKATSGSVLSCAPFPRSHVTT
jgi:hypothetical protein